MSHQDIEEVLDNPMEIEPEEDEEGSLIMVEEESIGDILTERQEKFCQLYTQDKFFFGNGVQAYLEVYNVDRSKKNRYKTACAASSRLLSNVKVCARINALLDSDGLNDENVDKQLLFLINQHDDKTSKLGAIKVYNDLKARVEKSRQKALDAKEITTDAIAGKTIAEIKLIDSTTLNEERKKLLGL